MRVHYEKMLWAIERIYGIEHTTTESGRWEIGNWKESRHGMRMYSGKMGEFEELVDSLNRSV